MSPTWEHQTGPETLGASQLLRIRLTPRAEAALLVLSFLLLFSIGQACSAQTSHTKTSPWLLQFRLNFRTGRGTKHGLCSLFRT